jgi:hypothetical protein
MNTMNENEAILLIEKMIQSAKREVKDNGFYFLLWGWLVLASALIDFALLKNVIPALQSKHALIWAILMPIGGAVSIIAGIRDSKKVKRVRTYVDDLMKYVAWAFSISLFLVCLVMPTTNNWPSFYPVLLIIYAIWLFISGGALRFKPLIYGGYANWIFAFVAFFVQYDMQLLLLASAVFLGYIVPGYLLNRDYHKNV